MKNIFKNKKALIYGGICLILIVSTIILIFSNNIKITPSEVSQLKLVDYEGNNFTMKIPEGWTVDSGGNEMFYAIRVYDPKDSRNQIFVLLKASPFLKSYQSKQFHEWYVNTTGNSAYNMFADAIILSNPTTENFYNNFNTYADYAKKYEPSYNNFVFPFVSVFTKIEEFESNTYMKSVSIDDKTIRATFEDNKGKKGEGLFMATLVDFGSAYAGNVDTSFYSAYNVIFITSAKDEFINYENILTESLNTLEYKSSFISSTNQSITEKTNASLKANATIQAAFDSYNSAWQARQTSYDISSQKYSDATLGYERVYDSHTGKIYKAYNGFISAYGGSRYKSATNDMYLKSVSGYIEK